MAENLYVIDIEEFTKNVQIEESNPYYPVYGDGIFDTLMETATKHLTAQFKANRIRKEDYADAYAHVYEVTLQAAMQIWLQKPEQMAKVDLITAQKLNTDADTELKGAQKAYIEKQADAAEKDIDLKQAQIDSENMKASLYKRQIEGYDENYKEKILKILLDAYTVVFSVAQEGFEGGIPKLITVSGINDICDIITKDLNTPATNNESDTTWVEKIRNDVNLTVPNSYSTAGWDENA